MELDLQFSEPPMGDRWQDFFSFVKNCNSKEIQEIVDDAQSDQCKTTCLSLLFYVGGQDCIHLLHENGLGEDEILRFKIILSKLEELCLLRIMDVYEIYKQSLKSDLDKSFPDGVSQTYYSDAVDADVSSNTLLVENVVSLSQERDPFDLTLINPASVIPTVDTMEEKVIEKENENCQETVNQVGSIKNDGNKNFENEFNDLQGSFSVKVEEGSYPVEQKINSSTSRKIKTAVNQADPSVRRSSRQIRVSPKYAESKEIIQNLLKPDVLVEDDKVSLEPSCICSLCKKRFPDSKKLVAHWKSHQNNKKKKCLTFLCKVCEDTFAFYSQLKIHYKRHLGDKNVKKSDCNSSKDAYKSTLRKKSFNKIVTDSNVNVKQTKDGKEESIGEGIEETIFICTKCNIIYDSEGDLEQHKISCRDEEEVAKFKSEGKSDKEKSPQDQKQSKDEGFLESEFSQCHEKMHGEIGKFQCKFCKKYFKSERKLDFHITLHTGEKPNVCEICGRAFRLRRSLIIHMRFHDESCHIKCEQCAKTFVDKKALESHKLVHSGVKPYSCDVCGKEFRRALGLRNHRRLHKTDEAIECDMCDKKFVDKWGMLKHKTIHTGEKPFICSHCGKMFRLKKGLMDHMKLHDKESQLKCHLCPRTFVQQRKLDLHLKAHGGEKPFICDKCGKGFMTAMNLKVHNRCHTGEKPYQCSFCERTFNQQGSLIAHERHHIGERPYVCDICGSSFITKSQLNIHTRKHYNDRPYKCDQCDYAAYTGSVLKIHKLKHSSEKPYKCLLCPSAFKRQHHLDVHRRTHLANTTDDNNSITDVIAHKCPYCEESFNSEHLLSSHITTHEIVVVTTETATNDIFIDQGPEEVAYNIVLL